MNEGAANEVPVIYPADRASRKEAPTSRGIRGQIGWIREQLDAGRIDCAYHGENYAVAIVNAESREDLEQLYGTMSLVELADRKVEALGSLLDQMQGVLESLRKYHLRKS